MHDYNAVSFAPPGGRILIYTGPNERVSWD